jgi:hypothetical protein
MRGSKLSKSIAEECLGILVLLCSPVGFAYTVTVTPSVAGPVPLGASFSVTVSSADMPTTVGAGLAVTWNPAVISIGAATPISPNFNFAGFYQSPYFSGEGGVVVISTSALGVAGPFNAVTLNLTAIGYGDAGLTIAGDEPYDPNGEYGWNDVNFNFALIPGIQYNQANIIVMPIPVPPAVWLFGSALGLIGAMRRKITEKHDV